MCKQASITSHVDAAAQVHATRHHHIDAHAHDQKDQEIGRLPTSTA